MQNSFIAVLGTGGTIAGQAASMGDQVGYKAGTVTVESLVAAVPALAAERLIFEQVAQVDSKDMDEGLWQALAHRVAALSARDDVAAIVITHGTDTLEETAAFLSWALNPAKPVVLTAAMRPASALCPDGPPNLRDAVAVARQWTGGGVLAVLNGEVWDGLHLRKVHPYAVQAFDGADHGPLGHVEEGQLRQVARPTTSPSAFPLIQQALRQGSPLPWPRVEVVFNHAGADGLWLQSMLGLRGQDGAPRLDGLIAAGTGNGTLSAKLQQVLQAAQDAGLAIRLCSRTASGQVVAPQGATFPLALSVQPWKARVGLMLELAEASLQG